MLAAQLGLLIPLHPLLSGNPCPPCTCSTYAPPACLSECAQCSLGSTCFHCYFSSITPPALPSLYLCSPCFPCSVCSLLGPLAPQGAGEAEAGRADPCSICSPHPMKIRGPYRLAGMARLPFYLRRLNFSNITINLGKNHKGS